MAKIRRLLCRIGLHSWKSVSFGYPPFSAMWHHWFECRYCFHSRCVVDQHAPPRPTCWDSDKGYILMEDEIKVIIYTGQVGSRFSNPEVEDGQGRKS